MNKFLVLLLVALTAVSTFADDADNADSLKCLVKALKEKGVHEEFFSSIDKPKEGVNCQNLIDVKVARAYDKIRDKLRADTFFVKYEPCIMQAIKNDDNKYITMQREAIKLNGLGVAVWNYFNQKEHLDELKKKIETSINKAASEKCVSVY